MRPRGWWPLRPESRPVPGRQGRQKETFYGPPEQPLFRCSLKTLRELGLPGPWTGFLGRRAGGLEMAGRPC